jgi:TetR/AcrR family transcriptional regulator
MDNKKPDQNTEERILEAAMKIFYREGIQGARMQDIADLANINRAMLHYYYRDKKYLSFKVIEKTVMKFKSAIKEHLDADIPFDEKIDKYIKQQIDNFSNNPELVIFALHESLSDKDLLKRVFENEQLNEKFINQLDDQIKTGKVRQFSHEEFVVFTISECAFPFIAGAIFKLIFNWDDEKWDAYQNQLKETIPEIIKRSIFTNYNPK